MELESIFAGNTFLIYFIGILYILLNKDLESNKKKVIIYVLVYSLKLFRIVGSKELLIGLFIVSFLYIEFLSEDRVKNVILPNIFDKVTDYIYKIVFEYSAVYFFISLFLMSETIVTKFFIMKMVSVIIPIIQININLISVILILFVLNNITSQKFETNSFTEIKGTMDKMYKWRNIKKKGIDTTKLNMLTSIEDKSFFYRKKTYNFLSIEFVRFRTRRLFEKIKYRRAYGKKHNQKESLINRIKKYRRYIRGYSTIEMQIIRTLGIKYGYDTHIFCRKIYEIVYSKLFFKSLRKYYNKIYLDTDNCCTFKEYLLMVYTKIAPIKLNNIRYDNMIKVWEKQDITEITDEQFFISILGLSYRWISTDILYNYSRIVNQYDLDKASIRRIIKEINKE